MRSSLELTFHAPDGHALFYRYFEARSPSPRGAILLFHRGHEHSGRIAHLVDELDLPDFAFFAWDARAHGRSPGRPGDRAGVTTSIEDVQTFVEHVARRHGFAAESVAVVGQSLAGVLLAAWAHDYAPRIRAMVLAAPAFAIKLYVPFARWALRLARALRGDFFVNSYVGARLLTHDPVRIESYDSDPLIHRAISVSFLLGLDELSRRIVVDAEAITVPTQILIAGKDYVVDAHPQHELYERLGARKKERHVFAGLLHDLLGERDRAQVLGEARRFLLECFDAEIERPSLLDADRIGFTRREADALARPLPTFSLANLGWGLARCALRVGGRWSEGIRVGISTGFDSGASLDYVYRNVATGKTRLGRWIDRRYLDALGWRGIRQRKQSVEHMIREAMDRLRDHRQPVRVLDVAAGAGRYLVDAIAEARPPAAVELRDYTDDNVENGRALIRERGLHRIATFLKRDAFARSATADDHARFTLGVVSGLYELYADNGLVRRSLEALAATIDVGGYLVYSGQPWHPQLEFIGRVLTSHRNGSAWVMRRRTQAELDELVAAAGFTKLAQRIDEWGLFTVSLARKSGISTGDRGSLAQAEATA
jgi:alpha-beta hydrolase superfamily lysophospholipase